MDRTVQNDIGGGPIVLYTELMPYISFFWNQYIFWSFPFLIAGVYEIFKMIVEKRRQNDKAATDS